jgi:MHS family alpha-ketoglutarate permease-like MFS transporter
LEDGLAAIQDTAAAGHEDTGRRVRAILGGSIGNLVEWFDWYTYAAFAVYFAPAFFPKGDQTAQLLNTAAVFALGFFMRPIGGWLLGRYGDKHGRKAGLTLSVLLMSLGSLIIACSPGYASIGLGAPALLLLARLMQGLSVGGEYGASATYLSEMATPKHRGFYSSFQYVTLIGGQLLALAVQIGLQIWLSEKELSDWGWRIPFFIGAACAIVAFIIRRKLDETQAFKDSKRPTHYWLELFKHPKAIATVLGLTLGGTVAFYTYSIYMQKFLVNTVHLSKPDATMISAATLLIFCALQPVVGALSDRVGRRPFLIGFGVLGTLLTVPMLTALSETQSAWVAFALIMGALVVVSGYTSINAIVKAELFPAEIRVLGVALPYAIANSLFGGTAEYVALWLKQAGHESWFYWYVSGCIFISLVVYITMSETRDHGHMTRVAR